MQPLRIEDWSLPAQAGSSHQPVLIIGLGNPILGDDGVGWRVAEWVKAKITSPGYTPNQDQPAPEIDCLSLGGLALMERMLGYRRVIIIDAINTGLAPVGTIQQYRLADIPKYSTHHLASAHDTSLPGALQVGQAMGAKIPEEITVVGIESNISYEFSEELSKPISQSVPTAGSLILELIK